MADILALGIKITVDDSDAPKLQSALKAAGVETKALGDAQQEAGHKTEEHTKKQETLHDALGTSRKETQLLTGAVLDVAGASPQATQAIEAFASGMTGVGLVTVVATAALAAAKQAIDDHIASLRTEASQLSGTNISLTEYSERTKELRVETALLTEAQEIMTQGIVRAAQHFAEATANMDALAAAELRVGQAMHAAQLVSIEAAFKTADAAKTDAQRAAALVNLAEAYAALEYPGKKWLELTAQQQAAALDYAAAIIRLRTEQKQLGDQLLIASGDALEFQNGMVRAASAADALTAAEKDLIASTNKFTDAQLAANDSRKEDTTAGRVAADKAASDATDAWIKKRDDAEHKAQQLADESARKAEQNAKTLAEFQKQGAAVSQFAGEAGKHAFEVIAASSLDAADKVRLLHEWEQQLPADVQQRINLYINTEGLAQLMALFHVRGPSGPGGNQQGDEYNFTLGGEANSIRNAYYDKYGPGGAEAAWQRDHRAELGRQGVTGPGQPNTQTGQTYDYGNTSVIGNAGSVPGGNTQVYVLNLTTQKSSSNAVQDFNTLKSLAGMH